MLSEDEVTQIATKAASDLGVPMPRLSFVPGKVSFMPVLAMNGGMTITPAARAALSAEALQFAIVSSLAANAHGDRMRGPRTTTIAVLAVLTGCFVSMPFKGFGQFLVAIVTTIIALVAYLFALTSITSKWPADSIDRKVLSVLTNLDGAREYAQTTDHYDLNREVPEKWLGPHGKLFDLERLERNARSMKLPYV